MPSMAVVIDNLPVLEPPTSAQANPAPLTWANFDDPQNRRISWLFEVSHEKNLVGWFVPGENTTQLVEIVVFNRMGCRFSYTLYRFV